MSGNDTHADTIRAALHFCADVHGDRTSQAVDALPSLAALVAEVERERARADRAEAALEPLAEALSWALDVLEISLKRIDTIDGAVLDDEHYRIRAAGLAKARAALDGLTDDHIEPPTTCGRDICPPTNDCRVCR